MSDSNAVPAPQTVQTAPTADYTKHGEVQSPAEGLEVIVKFYYNGRHGEHKKGILTRTMGKIGVLSKQWIFENPKALKPKHKEFWKVRILKETFVGQERGCFILEPLFVVPHIDVVKLIPGMFDEVFTNGILYIHPKTKDFKFIMSLDYKKKLFSERKCYSVVVPLNI